MGPRKYQSLAEQAGFDQFDILGALTSAPRPLRSHSHAFAHPPTYPFHFRTPLHPLTYLPTAHRLTHPHTHMYSPPFL